MAEDVIVTGKKRNQTTNNLVCKPDWLCLWNGKNITDKINPRAIEIQLTEKGGKEADELQITISDDDDVQLPQKGDEITLSIGWTGGMGVTIGLIDKGKFIVDDFPEISGPPDIITINAKSADFTKSNHIRRAQNHIDKTLGQILRQIAANMGAQARIDSEFENLQVPAIVKAAKSDLALLKELGQKYDAIATIKNKVLIFTKHGNDLTPNGAPIAAHTIARTDAPQFRFSQNSRDDTNGTEATYHDRATATKKTIRHGYDPNNPKKPHKIRKHHANEHDATQAAKSHHEKSKRGIKKLEIDLDIGRPDIFPNTKIKVTGYKTQINEINWVVKTATHTIGAGGLKTKLEMESA